MPPRSRVKATATLPPPGRVVREYMAANGVILLFRDGAGVYHRCSASMAGADSSGRSLRDGAACTDCGDECEGSRAALAALARHPLRTGAPATWTPERYVAGERPAFAAPVPAPVVAVPAKKTGFTRPPQRRR